MDFKFYVTLNEMYETLGEGFDGTLQSLSEGVITDEFAAFNQLDEDFKDLDAAEFAAKNNAEWITTKGGHKVCITKGKDPTIISGKFKGTKLKNMKFKASELFGRVKNKIKDKVKNVTDKVKDKRYKKAIVKNDWEDPDLDNLPDHDVTNSDKFISHGRMRPDYRKYDGIDVRHLKDVKDEDLNKIDKVAKSKYGWEEGNIKSAIAKSINKHFNKKKGMKDTTQDHFNHEFDSYYNKDYNADKRRGTQKYEKALKDAESKEHIGKRTNDHLKFKGSKGYWKNAKTVGDMDKEVLKDPTAKDARKRDDDIKYAKSDLLRARHTRNGDKESRRKEKVPRGLSDDQIRVLRWMQSHIR